jgi:glycosyltransferase involved in cell wall biosynthesis
MIFSRRRGTAPVSVLGPSFGYHQQVKSRILTMVKAKGREKKHAASAATSNEVAVPQATARVIEPVAPSVQQAAGHDPYAKLEALRAELEGLLKASTSVQTARQNLREAEELAQNVTNDATVSLVLLQLKERAGLGAGLLEEWARLSRDCPNEMQVIRCYAAQLVKHRRVEEALALVDQHIPERMDEPREALLRAELLSDIKAHGASDALFQRLIAQYDRRDLRVAFAKRLAKRGLLADAAQMLEPVAHTLAPESKAGQLAAKVNEDYAFYRQYESAAALAGQDIKIVAMKQSILKFRNRVVSDRQPGHAVSVALVTGNLGPGGAERQLARLAGHLKRCEGAQLTGVENATGLTVGAVEVLVKQHTDPGLPAHSQKLDFFLGSLTDNGVKVSEINRMAIVAASHQDIQDPDLLRMLGNLPPQMHYGVTRLASYLRERNFDVVSLWQDGSCLFGALAALLAGVPVIHLVFRGLPPNIRRERHRPEYEPFYRAMAQIPGVSFVSNSQTGAQEYAKWLDMSVERFRILYNGVPEMDTGAPERDQEKWNAFARTTADATETIGGVFRFEPDKRPLLWIKLAHRYLKKRPHARFVIVGDGRFHENAIELAQELGIADRLLLVGLSTHVGFWYSKMDVKVLLSRHEGLPNVLIEAQLLGVCTVSTPAGGAGECFVDGLTGYLLDCAENPNLNEACEKIEALIVSSQSDESIRQHSRQRARMLFSVDAMINTFASLCSLPVRQAKAELLETGMGT